MATTTTSKTLVQRLLRLRPSPTILLFIATIAAVIIANTGASDLYNAFLNFPVYVSVGGIELFAHSGHTMTVSQVVNDALMAIFFFLVGLEIKQELLVGELSSPKKALLPIIAAFGGMIVPVLFFFVICHQQPESMGAAIPMATDIAFALAVLASLGERVPKSLRVFLAALAVVDDIGGIIVIAIFYSAHVSWLPLAIGIALLGLILLLGRARIHTLEPYLILGVAVWALFLHSGIHPTIAGVLTALCLPAGTKVHIGHLSERLSGLTSHLSTKAVESNGALVLSHEQLESIQRIRSTAASAISPVQTLEHAIAPCVNYFILPLFAFVNAGVAFGGFSPEALLGIPAAIFLGLFPGKAIGISLFTWLAVKLRMCSLPEGLTVHRLLPLSVLGGIGFTVSLFIANLSYDTPDLISRLNEAKLGIFAGTIASGLIGYFWLRSTLPQDDAAA
nr:Na+/H+ antiporter NhaA [uncultured Porphyromonas sp.]